jgi:hypothetical protein
VARRRERALVITCEQLDGEQMIAQAHVTDDSEVWRAGQRGTRRITAWLAATLGLPRAVPTATPRVAGPCQPGLAGEAAPRAKFLAAAPWKG